VIRRSYARPMRPSKKVIAALTSVILAGCADSTGPLTDPLVWTAVEAPGIGEVTGISGTSASDIWAVGWERTVLHFDGATWSSVSTGFEQEPYKVWARTRSDVWIIGTHGTTPEGPGSQTIVHYDGTKWSISAIPTSGVLTSVWSSSASDVWAVSTYGEIAHYDGTSWSSVKSGMADLLWTVWGTSPSDVWFGGSYALLHFDGSGWSIAYTPHVVYAIWGTSRSDVWAADSWGLLHYDGAEWSSVPSGFDLDTTYPYADRGGPYVIWGASRSSVWVAGAPDGPNDGTCCAKMQHYNGASWSDVLLGARLPFVNGMWGSSASDVWAVTQSGILHGTPAR
jgi:hypothetical protein